VLLIGAGVSSTDIARECTPFAKKIYQSSRGGRFDLPPTFLPEGAERVAGVSSFEMPGKNQTATVNLVDGTILEGIDRIIIATGYLMTLPFLPDHQDDLMPVEDANDQVLVTDGSQYHNLHKDIFYIPDTTLAFVGVPAYSATFTFFEYQAIAVDAVFSQRAKLPSTSQMRAEYQDKVKAKGFGRAFHSVRDEEVEYVKDLVCFVNSNIKPGTGRRIEAHTEAWIAERKLLSLKLKDRFESTRKDA
jgi:cation diffusion facilitator CzcD-associated flavoprotein CzcO